MEAPTIHLPMHTRLSQSTCTAMPPWSLMAMMVAPVRRTMRINVEHEPRLQTKLTYQIQPNSSEKRMIFSVNGMNKHALIKLISGHLREKGSHTIQAEGDADLDIVKEAVAMSAYKSTTLIGEDTDLLVLLLYHAPANDCKHLYFRSDAFLMLVHQMYIT